MITRIARDESAHGAFGWVFLDWADELLDDGARLHLRGVASRAIAALEQSLEGLAAAGASGGPSLGWLSRERYLATARKTLDEDVIAPLRARGLV